jgi:hypothetical protein
MPNAICKSCKAVAGLPDDALLSILSTICELPQAVLINVVDLLANGTCRVSGVVGGHHHVAMTFAAHGCNEVSMTNGLVYIQLSPALGGVVS